MAKKEKGEDFFEVEPNEEISKKPSHSKKSATGKVYAIRGGKILVDVGGNGMSLKYDEKLHANLKVGDEIEV